MNIKRITPAIFIAALLAGAMLAIPGTSSAQVSIGVAVNFGPPPLPVYPQPYAPAPGYIWTPGYWAYGPYGYYWVPGTWVLAPAVGLLWTPGWWGWGGGFYRWHTGYWGPHVGYYGGVNYGYGYTGVGYEGGYWRGHAFYYNRAVSNVNVTVIHNTYNRTVINRSENRVSYNGGPGGINDRPSAAQESYASERHVPATTTQMRQENLARSNPAQRFSANHGRPEIAATARPGKFTGSGVVRMNSTKGSYEYNPAAHNTKTPRPASRNAQHVENPPNMRPENSNAQRHEESAPRPEERGPQPQEHEQRPDERAPQPQEHAERPEEHKESKNDHKQKDNGTPPPRDLYRY
ncbi:MAG: YXWGXW repeat-containing protein [Gammaproteobacteria bacterium]